MDNIDRSIHHHNDDFNIRYCLGIVECLVLQNTVSILMPIKKRGEFPLYFGREIIKDWFMPSEICVSGTLSAFAHAELANMTINTTRIDTTLTRIENFNFHSSSKK